MAASKLFPDPPANRLNSGMCVNIVGSKGYCGVHLQVGLCGEDPTPPPPCASGSSLLAWPPPTEPALRAFTLILPQISAPTTPGLRCLLSSQCYSLDNSTLSSSASTPPRGLHLTCPGSSWLLGLRAFQPWVKWLQRAQLHSQVTGCSVPPEKDNALSMLQRLHRHGSSALGLQDQSGAL